MCFIIARSPKIVQIHRHLTAALCILHASPWGLFHEHPKQFRRQIGFSSISACNTSRMLGKGLFFHSIRKRYVDPSSITAYIRHPFQPANRISKSRAVPAICLKCTHPFDSISHSEARRHPRHCSAYAQKIRCKHEKATRILSCIGSGKHTLDNRTGYRGYVKKSLHLSVSPAKHQIVKLPVSFPSIAKPNSVSLSIAAK